MKKWLYCISCALLQPIETDTKIGVWGDEERLVILGHEKVTGHKVTDIPQINGLTLISDNRANEGKLRREFLR